MGSERCPERQNTTDAAAAWQEREQSAKTRYTLIDEAENRNEVPKEETNFEMRMMQLHW